MPAPKIPAHTVEPDGPGRLIVKVRGEIAGHVSEDAEHPGLWVAEDQDGRFMGRVGEPEKAAAFLAAWFGAEDEDAT
ncbi:hypothetical protein E8E01_23455 [Methylorubrum populi]|uniref:hypothetical protein n=1 Tax=Methylorubrum populi TaxID=223967 RepID=UPI001152B7A0|nr:hypothetical protein [Methylorubrum populi]QDI83156.1 hypothetical protein E8E01_23455 [Methylorubrum populi]